MAERPVFPRGLYSDHARIEVSEAIHFHYRDHRFMLTTATLRALSDLFREAVHRWTSMGAPEHSPVPYHQVDGLAEVPLPDEGFHSRRLAVEEESDGTIHVHYRDLRIHLRPADFLLFANEVEVARKQYVRVNETVVSMASVQHHPIVTTWRDYLIRLPIDRPPVPDFETVWLQSREETSRSMTMGTFRPNGLPPDVPAPIEKDTDIGLLEALYRSICLHGYASGPYRYNLIRVYRQKDGTLMVKDSHRLACLQALGLTQFRAIVVPAESGWREEPLVSPPYKDAVPGWERDS